MASVVEKLIEAIKFHSKWPGEDKREVIDAVADPQWDDYENKYDWRRFVDCDVSAVWDELPIEAKLVAYLTAFNQAYYD